MGGSTNHPAPREVADALTDDTFVTCADKVALLKAKCRVSLLVARVHPPVKALYPLNELSRIACIVYSQRIIFLFVRRLLLLQSFEETVAAVFIDMTVSGQVVYNLVHTLRRVMLMRPRRSLFNI